MQTLTMAGRLLSTTTSPECEAAAAVQTNGAMVPLLEAAPSSDNSKEADQSIESFLIESIDIGIDGYLASVANGVLHAVGVCGRVLELAVYFAPPLMALPSILAARYILPGVGGRMLDKWWRWILWAVQNNGPALIKWGQWAASRRDLFPVEFCVQFSQLHEMAPTHAWESSQATLVAEFGADWDEHLSLEKEPIGSGCIAQVREATRVCALRRPEKPHVLTHVLSAAAPPPPPAPLAPPVLLRNGHTRASAAAAACSDPHLCHPVPSACPLPTAHCPLPTAYCLPATH